MGYILIGLLWCLWLEWFTSNKLTGVLGRPWVWRERFFHTLLWPVSLSIFLYNIFNG